MAQAHLSAFLEQIKKLNPDFRQWTSSLNGLINYLQSTVSNPQRFANRQAALNRCSKPADPRLAKYRSAIDNLVEVWGKGERLPFPGQEVDIGRLVFRGDDREPGVIFKSGFTPRNPTRLGPTYRFDKEDLDPNSGVCFTPDPRVAANFPFPETKGPESIRTFNAEKARTWVYALYVEKGFNTNAFQALRLNDATGGLNPMAAFVVYSQEMAASTVPVSNILGAMRCERKFFGGIKQPTKRCLHCFADTVNTDNGICSRCHKQTRAPMEHVQNGVFHFEADTWALNPQYTGPYKDQFISLARNAFPTGWKPFVRPQAGYSYSPRQ